MAYWSPKHAELLNAVNKINRQILCILLDYICTAKWYMVHTTSDWNKPSDYIEAGDFLAILYSQ